MSQPPPKEIRTEPKAQEDGRYADPVETLATELMTATKRGDDDAFDRLTRTVRGRAFRIAASLVGSRDDALELAQEALLKTYRARETYRDGEPFLPWFHRILRNTCYSFLRKHRRVKRQSLVSERDGEEHEWEIEGDAPAPFEGAEQAEAKEVFWRAFELLSARDREMLSLRHFDELSYKEIAHALDIPEGTVMSRLFHARRRLRDLLAPHLEDALSDYAVPESASGKEQQA